MNERSEVSSAEPGTERAVQANKGIDGRLVQYSRPDSWLNRCEIERRYLLNSPCGDGERGMEYEGVRVVSHGLSIENKTV